jgi:hypothetical protein
VDRHRDASAATEAAGLYRDLARERSEAFTSHLAGSLNNLAVMLSEIGGREDGRQPRQRRLSHRLRHYIVKSDDQPRKIARLAHKQSFSTASTRS